jgi:hypothetical protein
MLRPRERMNTSAPAGSSASTIRLSASLMKGGCALSLSKGLRQAQATYGAPIHQKTVYRITGLLPVVPSHRVEVCGT